MRFVAESSAYVQSEWIEKLVAYVKDVAERITRIKIIGKLTSQLHYTLHDDTPSI